MPQLLLWLNYEILAFYQNLVSYSTQVPTSKFRGRISTGARARVTARTARARARAREGDFSPGFTLSIFYNIGLLIALASNLNLGSILN